MTDMVEKEDEPYENTLSLEELRREVRKRWDTENDLVRALKDLPEVPSRRVQHLLSCAAKYPEDWERGKLLQRQNGSGAIPYKTEHEMGAGLWARIREGLDAALSNTREKDNG